MGVDGRHCRVDNFNFSRRKCSSELRLEEPVEAVIFVGESLRRRPTKNVDPNQLRAAFFGKRIFPRVNI